MHINQMVIVTMTITAYTQSHLLQSLDGLVSHQMQAGWMCVYHSSLFARPSRTIFALQVQGLIKSDDKAVYVCGRELYNRACCEGPRCRHDWPVAMPIWGESAEQDECDAPLPHGWTLIQNRLVWPQSYDPAKHFSTFEQPYLNLVRC